MASEDRSDSGASGDTREQGIEFGELNEKLVTHDYPATGDELIDAYGDFELELPGGSKTFRERLGKRESESGADENDDIRYESAEEVHRSVLNMVGADAVGRANYSDRGGSQKHEGKDHDDSM